MILGEALVEELTAAYQEINRAQARMLTAVHAITLATPVRKYAAEEVSAALALSTGAARNQVELARDLIEDLPDVFTAVQSGRLNVDRGKVFADILRFLDLGKARQVAASVLPVAAELTIQRLRRLLLSKAMEADPTLADKRRKQAIKDRRVELYPQDDGTAVLIGLGLPADRASSAWERLDAIARAEKQAGAQSTLDQLRTDAFLRLLEGTPTGGPIDRQGVVELVLKVSVVDGQAIVDGGELAGFGPVAASQALEIALRHLDYPWSLAVVDSDGRLVATATRPGWPGKTGGVCDPDDLGGGGGSRRVRRGYRVQVGPPAGQDPKARRANAATQRWVRTRDRTCRWPGCLMPARATDLDHTVDRARGGATADWNLCPLCRRHHRAKHAGGWKLIQLKAGWFRWISPLGRIYDVGPEPP